MSSKNEWYKTEKGKACRRRYYEANIDKLRAYGRDYYHAHKANPTTDTGTPHPARPRPAARPEPDIRDQLRQEQDARQARINAKRAEYAKRQPFAQQESNS